MNSDMVKPERFGHLHLVYHFTVPLSRMATREATRIPSMLSRFVLLMMN